MFRSGRRQRPGADAAPTDERGASMVEFAIGSSVFLLLMLGLIDFSLTLFDLNAAAAGVREGAHAAGALIGTTSGAATTCPGLTATSFDHPAGTEDDTEALRIICRTKNRLLTSGGVRARVRLRFEDADGNPADGIVNSPADNRFIVVCAQVQARSITGAFTPVMSRITFMSRGRERLDYSNSTDPEGSFHVPSGGETFFDTSKTC